MDLDRLFIASNFKGEIVIETTLDGLPVRIVHAWDASAPNDLNDAAGAVVTRIHLVPGFNLDPANGHGLDPAAGIVVAGGPDRPLWR